MTTVDGAPDGNGAGGSDAAAPSDSPVVSDGQEVRSRTRRKLSKTPPGRRTASRLSQLAGGTASAELERTVGLGESDDGEGGVTAGLAAQHLTNIAGHAVIDVPIDRIAPHPFNDPARSQPKPGDAKWDDLLASVKSSGVRVPSLMVTRSAFVAIRPGLAAVIGDVDYILVYGHRRRAASCEAGHLTMPAVVDDRVMEDHGDLDAMALENRGRADLSVFAEAEQFARYSEEGIGQRAIADRLGIDQTTVSRRMALLLLAPEVREAVESDRLPTARAAALAGALPYGPGRKWQRTVAEDQDSAQRRIDQVSALQLILEDGREPDTAARYVLAARAASEDASQRGIKIIDPAETFGQNHHAHRLYDDAAVRTALDAGVLTAAVDVQTGELAYYTTERREMSEQTGPGAVRGDGTLLRAAATRSRRIAAAGLVSNVPGREKLLTVLAGQYTLGLTGLAASRDAMTLAQKWSHAASVGPVAGDAAEYRAAVARLNPPSSAGVAWVLALAAYEVAASSSERVWGRAELTYLDLLIERGGYAPTAWEHARMEEARRDLAADAAPSDEMAEAIRSGELLDARGTETSQDDTEADVQDAAAG